MGDTGAARARSQLEPEPLVLHDLPRARRRPSRLASAHRAAAALLRGACMRHFGRSLPWRQQLRARLLHARVRVARCRSRGSRSRAPMRARGAQRRQHSGQRGMRWQSTRRTWPQTPRHKPRAHASRLTGDCSADGECACKGKRDVGRRERILALTHLHPPAQAFKGVRHKCPSQFQRVGRRTQSQSSSS